MFLAEPAKTQYLVRLVRRESQRSVYQPGAESAHDTCPGKGDAGNLPRPVPIDHEQHRAEHDTVVPLQPLAHGCGQFLGVPSRVLLAPVRDGGPGPC
jgi:hypothetical protein